MNELILWLVIFGVIFFVLLILRFFQPEFIYILREAVTKVEMHKLFLDKDENKILYDYKKRYQELLSNDFRPESRRFDKLYVHWRLTKVKELYKLQHAPDSDGKRFQNCVVELANLLSNIAQNLTLNEDIRYPITYAPEVLQFLKEERIKRDENFATAELINIEEWLEKNPISIEQTVEVLIALIHALSIREKQQF